MIIDFHTHTYPEQIAGRAIDRLAAQNDIFNYSDGTVDGLSRSQLAAGIDYSVVLPVATKPSQVKTINENALMMNEKTRQTHLIYFAAIHPDCDDAGAIIDEISLNGFIGIKLHPMSQQTFIDDERYLRIIDRACENGLLVQIHSGADITFPGDTYSSPIHTKKMLDTLGTPPGIILAHMGGLQDWDDVFALLSGYDVFLDTSSSLEPLLTYAGKKVPGPFRTPLSHSLFYSLVDAFGADHILFGSDSPWGGQKEALAALNSSGLDERELRLIRGENAARLLEL